MHAHAARAAIPVPEFPAQQIRTRAHAAAARIRTRIAALVGAFIFAAVGVQAGIAAKLVDGVRVWLSGDKTAVAVDSCTMANFPSAAQLG